MHGDSYGVWAGLDGCGGKGDIGATGTTGATGPAGAAGPAGANGQLRIYGDGSAGALTVAANGTLFVTAGLATNGNAQFTNVTVNPGVTLTVPSGTIIRCTERMVMRWCLRVTSSGASGHAAVPALGSGRTPPQNWRSGEPVIAHGEIHVHPIVRPPTERAGAAMCLGECQR